jgi:NTE family protein
MAKRALVLGGGGITGIAWETGVVAGLIERGVDLYGFDRFVGTSAGSVVTAQIATRVPFEQLFEAQKAPMVTERGASIGFALIARFMWNGLLSRGDVVAWRKRMGRLSLAKTPPPDFDWVERFKRLLPVHQWPEVDLRITAVHARTGEPRVIDRHSGVALPLAVAASCAVPGVWPPVPIESEPYMDGGFRSITNADLAEGCDEVIVVAPITRNFGPMPRLRAQVEALQRSARVTVITPDDASLKAIGRDVLDPTRREPAARAGRDQVQALALP